MMNSVCVLMSTYNGEKYVRQQLDSILCQTEVKLTVLIRDDGSTDRTTSILEEYAKHYDNLRFYVGENVGPAMSFIDLIFNSPDADFYSFSDQDDVWDQNKLKRAVEALYNKNLRLPSMYFSNLRIVDQNLNFYRLSHSSFRGNENKYSCFVESVATGCTIVFNHAALLYIKRKRPETISMHDTWLYMVCKVFGEVIYDPSAYINYRQHESNVVGTYLNKKTIKLYLKRIKEVFICGSQACLNNAKTFWICFNDLLSEKDKQKIKKILNYKMSFSSRIRLCADKDFCPKEVAGKIKFWSLVFLGRF